MEQPNFIFESSWEVCNKIGGIYTVLATKLPTLKKMIGDNLVYIGPDFGKDYTPADFKEDNDIFNEWQENTLNTGLNIRTGYWDIAGNPKVILVDFTPLRAKKDEIFTKLWKNNKVDSINGSGIYIDAVLFGYAVGQIIDNFIDFYNLHSKKAVAHFHEWMSATGILYLKNNYTSVSTVFTTHATSLGRSICSNGLPLYEYLNSNPEAPDAKAKELNILSQHSLEKIIAHTCNCFTTVSKLTARECEILLGKTPDCITPNGYDTIPKEQIQRKKLQARKVLTHITEALTGKLHNPPLFIATSGRYEFRNKGVDLFISSLAQLRKKNPKKEIIAFLLIPTANNGANITLQRKLANEYTIMSDRICTHNIKIPQQDRVLSTLHYYNIRNNEGENVKVIFAPVYLNGNDGIFNMSYYDLLCGFDLSIFPSYYEPWGYTPQESVGAGIPTITTTLAGFGLWAEDFIEKQEYQGTVSVIPRTENNYEDAVVDIVNNIQAYASLSNENVAEIQKRTFALAKEFTWDKFFSQYKKTYSIALENFSQQKTKLEKQLNMNDNIQTLHINWKKLFVQSNLPEPLKKLDEISMNLWWTWNDEAKDLFKNIDNKAWIESDKNPILMLRNTNQERLQALSSDKKYLDKLNKVYDKFKSYMSEKPQSTSEHIAYFSMEYGITNILKIYSGGLGILAGDYLKEASDSNIPMVAIGFMYKHGYFKQQLSTDGSQIAVYDTQVFSELPVQLLRGKDGEPITISLPFPGREVHFRVWKAQVGRVDLYLLDTTISANQDEDKPITHTLYGGNWENRIKQEIILGMGGVKLINMLNVNANICHLNEGHAAFANLERLRNYVQKNLSFAEALEVVRASSIFTTHTPVPAGHDAFTEDFIRNYLGNIPQELNLSWEEFLGLGRFKPENLGEKFSMSVFAAKTSQEINGVSMLHGEVSRKMFNDLWIGYGYNELALGYVTNGVHYETWTAPEWQKLHNKYLDKSYIKDLSNKELWKNIYYAPDDEIWSVRNKLRKRLIDYIRDRIFKHWVGRNDDPQVLVDIHKKISEDVFTIGFARRFATYKRAHLLFSDLDRLEKLLNNPERPVQLLFAGKAHPADRAGQDSMKRIIEISRMPQFAGKVIFLENYNINLAKKLISGVDVWMNTPTRPLEASGTSGQKASMNGVLNFSVLDGWWVEGFKENAGWALPQERTYEDQHMQDKLDAAFIYYTLENEVIPIFYDRDENGIPREWIQYIKNNFAEITPEFTTKRMIDDYNNKFYKKLHSRVNSIRKNNFAIAKKIVKWKDKITENWNEVAIVEINFPNTLLAPYIAGESFSGTIILDLKNLKDEQPIVEMVFAKNNLYDQMEVVDVKPLKLDKMEGTLAHYKTTFTLNNPGLYDYGLRITPQNPDLPHKQDFICVSWIQ